MNERAETTRRTPAVRGVEALSLTVALVILWSLTHRYRGLTGDGELYAIQAFAKVLPSLANDLFLKSTSQDNFTVFSPLYAAVISGVGLPTAAIGLTLFFKTWFYGAAWVLIRGFVSRNQAFLGLVLLIVVHGAYGAFNVFQFSEDFVTARSVAEALIVTAVALDCRGHRLAALLTGAVAMLFHPIMALPGILLLLCMRTPEKWRIAAGAAAAMLAALGIACYGAASASGTGSLAVLDPRWLEVVRERSQFLFLQLWSLDDWKTNSRPFITLTLTVLASRDAQLMKLGTASLLVGFTGCAVAFIAGAIGPVAILIQGQAWRWLWIPTFLSIALMAPTMVHLLKDRRCGPLCALLLILGWTFSPVDSLVCLIPALVLWLLRDSVRAGFGRALLLATYGLALIALGWTAATSWGVLHAPSPESGREVLGLARARDILGLQIPAVVGALLLYAWLEWNRSRIVLGALCATLVATASFALPGTVVQFTRDEQNSRFNDFRDWRAVIPPDSNVYVSPENNSATFSWFTLQRSSYLSLDQSAGVVFSRETALEVARRSQVLLPLTPPDWKLLSAMEARHRGAPKSAASASPITREALSAVCQDAQLGFVIAEPDVGFEPTKHTHPGKWKDWNLYDCAHIRAAAAASS